MLSGLFIDGAWREGAGRLEVFNKYNQQMIGSVAVPSSSELDRAFQASLGGARACAELTAYQRSQILNRVADRLLVDLERLAQVIVEEAGKPIKFARLEVQRASNTFRVAAEESRRMHGETIPFDASPNGQGYFGFWRRRPVGVVGAITPFNFPLNLVAHKVAPAIASGNAFILKPAEQTPLMAVALFEILLQSGLPESVGQLLQGDGPTIGGALVRDQRVGKISFTGSAEVGREIVGAAGIKKVTLELGNTSPVIVAPDADLEAVARRCASGAFAHSGQICISVQRIYGDKAIQEELIERMIEATRAIVVGDPMEDATDVGPMIAESEARRIESWVAQATLGGARCLIGGEREGPVYWPTLLADTDEQMTVMRREVFAPLASMIPYRDFDDALRRANGTDYGLHAAIFTRDIDRVLRAIDQLDFGGVIVNDMPTFRVDQMPYGGNKQSGLGREGVRYAMEEMTNIQTVAIRSPAC